MGHLCSNGKVSEYWPDFDEANDLFNELSDAKEQLLEDLFKEMRTDVEKINENSNENADRVIGVIARMEELKLDQICK